MPPSLAGSSVAGTMGMTSSPSPVCLPIAASLSLSHGHCHTKPQHINRLDDGWMGLNLRSGRLMEGGGLGGGWEGQVPAAGRSSLTPDALLELVNLSQACSQVSHQRRLARAVLCGAGFCRERGRYD